MPALLISLLSFGIGAAGAIVFARHRRLPVIFGTGGTLVACVFGITPALRAVLGAPVRSIRFAWDVPYGSVFLRLDALSGFFLLLIFLLCGLCAIYGAEYLEAYRERHSLAAHWFFFNVLSASMVLVVLAHNGILFIVAWETMALSSFFLVTFENEQTETRRAGWIYLIASHAGTAFLLALFILLGRINGSLDFNRFAVSTGGAGLLFVLALIGFGTKAGFVPLHVWLPEAHPAAPTHVSAVMSAAMIKTGIYGLLRALTFLGVPAPWWGYSLCGLGLISGIAGILLALAQSDLKRVLAYSSVENAGIIALGLGVGLIGISKGIPALAVIGFAGALLHVLNHSLFKGLLFLSAGNVLHATHTRNIEVLGGLLKRMPHTGTLFLVGAVAISGLPPFNGFVSEFLIYFASFRGAVRLEGTGSALMLATIAALALIGGLAAVCLTRVFGIVFLGEPRTQAVAESHETRFPMLLPGFVLAAGCLLIGLFAANVVTSMGPLLALATGLSERLVQSSLSEVAYSVARIGYIGGALIILIVSLSIARALMLARRTVIRDVTWDCGYALWSPRMQYTASSFAQPLTSAFGVFLQTRNTLMAPRGLFPNEASFYSETPDPYQAYLFRPLFVGLRRGFLWLRPLQQGKVQLYILYIALTLIALLLWQLS